MDRRGFIGCGIAGTLGVSQLTNQTIARGAKEETIVNSVPSNDYRKLFPRTEHETYLNAAGGMPQAEFAKAAARRFDDYWCHGEQNGYGNVIRTDYKESRERFAKLIGATASEIACVQNTKAGEQIVIDSIPSIRNGGNIVTNDLHFAGALHNLVGIQKSGVDVRIVKSVQWKTDLQEMKKQIDGKTSLVCIALVSNVNGNIEPIRELTDHAHKMGAVVYADIIQAAGIVPFDVRQMGIDFAGCSGYKWLFGIHGAGFLFVGREHQGTVLEDRVFPGHLTHHYEPWVEASQEDGEEFEFHAPTDARRYQTGHVSYVGYSLLNAGLRFIESIGVETLLKHSTNLVHSLADKIDKDKYPCISPMIGLSPIISFKVKNEKEIRAAFRNEKIVASLGKGRIRISPAIFNNEDDIDRLVDVLNKL